MPAKPKDKVRADFPKIGRDKPAHVTHRFPLDDEREWLRGKVLLRIEDGTGRVQSFDETAIRPDPNRK